MLKMVVPAPVLVSRNWAAMLTMARNANQMPSLRRPSYGSQLALEDGAEETESGRKDAPPEQEAEHDGGAEHGVPELGQVRLVGREAREQVDGDVAELDHGEAALAYRADRELRVRERVGQPRGRRRRTAGDRAAHPARHDDLSRREVVQDEALEVQDDDGRGEEHADAATQVRRDEEREAVGRAALEEEELAQG